MQTDTTGPALATDRLTRSIQALRDDARAQRGRGRGGLRAVLVPVAAADAARMAIAALFDVLLRLIQEFAAAQGRDQGRAQGRAQELAEGRLDVVAAGLAPSPVDAGAPGSTGLMAALRMYQHRHAIGRIAVRRRGRGGHWRRG